MSSNHPELMRTYPNPLLDFIPSAEQYAIERSRASLNRSCSGLHFPHVLAPWGVPQYLLRSILLVVYNWLKLRLSGSARNRKNGVKTVI
eukprot:COSAG06_NODE_8217_length_2234_cov_1.994848_1_plen_89_part_00